MRADGWQEKPLQGAVVCCTSISPELRSRYAEYVIQLGGEHKLDLTSDVTHLLVGDTDTPKYKYVAKEREDVKVLRPEWAEAVRKRWMADESVNLNELAAQHRVSTLAGLKICITGFDDLTFRAQLQKNVVENGGQYTGDLTKDVTHLIAARPSGKKFEYGTQWGKKVVSLRWYKDTLERGMQLDEASYHPSVPDEEQGRGAWNRTARKPHSPGKRRQRDDSQVSDQPRKLRRTASARFNSQNDSMWTDIVSKEPPDDDDTSEKQVQHSRSVPNLRQPKQGEDDQSWVLSQRQGIFAARHFVLEAFAPQQMRILKNVVLSHGGSIVDTLTDLRAVSKVGTATRILLLPHQTSLEQIPNLEDGIEVASELWIEHCMFSKTFHLPSTYPLGQFLPRVKPTGFSKLVVTSTGFAGITPNHIAKIVHQLGAKYEQTFKMDASVLICNSQGCSRQKAELARSWRIPTVSEKWLWACLKENRQASFEKYAVPATRRSGMAKSISAENATTRPRIGAVKREASPTTDAGAPDKGKPLPLPSNDIVDESTVGLGQDEDGFVMNEDQPVLIKADTDHQESDDIKKAVEAAHKPSPEHRRPASTKSDFELTNSKVKPVAQVETVLRAISPNLSPQRRNVAKQKPNTRSLQPYDGADSDVENRDREQKINGTNTAPKALDVDAKALNGEIRELLDLKSKLKEKRSESVSSKPKKQLMGRALSNLSNASSTSHVRQSRAGSVDSVNTDGVGQEILPSASDDRKTNGGDSYAVNSSFTGRATSKLFESRTTPMSAIVASAAAAVAEDEEAQWAEPAQEPALTQLVYEDPEEVLQSRQKLAAKRRQRSKTDGEKESDAVKPAKKRATPAKRIKDDDVFADAGWGAGRRTRNKPSPPGGLKEF